MKFLSEKIIYTPEYAGRFDLATGIEDFEVDIEFEEKGHIYKKGNEILTSVTQILHRGFYENPYNMIADMEYEDCFSEEYKNHGTIIHEEIEDYLKKGIVGKSNECKNFIKFFNENKNIFEQKAIFDFKATSKCEKRYRELCFKQLSMYCEGIYYLSGQIIDQAYMIWMPNSNELKLIDLTKEFGNPLSFNKYNNKKISWNKGNHFIINGNNYLSVGIPHTLVLIDNIGKASSKDFREIARKFEPDFNSRNISDAEHFPFKEYIDESASLEKEDYWINKNRTSSDDYWSIDKRRNYYVKPVIFVKSDYQLDGEGTEFEPYEVDENYLYELKLEEDKKNIINKLLLEQKKYDMNKVIYKCDNDGNILEKYDSPRDAETKSGVSYQSIISSASSIQRFGGGFVWVYQKEYEEKYEQLFNEQTKLLKPNTNKAKAIYMLDDNDNIIKEFQSVADAAKYACIDKSCIRDAANGKQIHAAGYKWKFKEETDSN